jgi:hypothetical protein
MRPLYAKNLEDLGPNEHLISVAVYNQKAPMKRVALSKQARLKIQFCDLCGARLLEGNTNRRFRNRCNVCATPRGKREAEVAVRRQTQIISGFKPPGFWKSSGN